MRHTSIRLADHHAALIEATEESPTEVIRKALDAYFGRSHMACLRSGKLSRGLSGAT